MRLPLLLGRNIKIKLRDPIKFGTSDGIVEQFIATQTLSLTSFKDFSKKHGIRIQSLLLAIYGGVIRRYLEGSEKPIPEYIIIPIPQFLPGRPRFLIGNHFSNIIVPVPLVQHGSIMERARAIEARILENNSTNTFLLYPHVFVKLISVLPINFLNYLYPARSTRTALSPVVLPEAYSYQTRRATPTHPIFGITSPKMGKYRMRSLYG